MTRPCTSAVDELLPHGPEMVLLDEIVAWDEGFISTAVSIRETALFYCDGFGVPAYVGLEYMAQTCGVFAGLKARRAGAPIGLGFLLGTRNFQAECDWFPPGSRLTVNGRELFRENPMGVFDCRILLGEVEVASAQLNLYQPENVEEILNGETKI